MQLKHWRHDVIDLSDHPDFVQQPHLSILANAVDFLNERLSLRAGGSSRSLEVGCGVQSVFRDKLGGGSRWEGIDVFARNERGVPTIATRIASVAAIPFPAGSFDVVLANQSIEHWHEYHVGITAALAEIRRVLSDDGRAVINFPVHLHGHRFFVRGDFGAIDKCFADAGLDVVKRSAVIDSRRPDYKGWRKCSFPDFYIHRNPRHEDTSYVVEYEARPAGGRPAAEAAAAAPQAIPGRVSPFYRNAHHGPSYLLWKTLRTVRRRYG